MSYGQHFEEDGRCGGCFEEWPCDGFTNKTTRSGIYAWAEEAERRKRQAEDAARQQRMIDIAEERRAHVAKLTAKTDRCNELFKLLGYDLMQIPEAASGLMLKTEFIQELLERLYEYERPGQAANAMGGPSDVPSGGTGNVERPVRGDTEGTPAVDDA